MDGTRTKDVIAMKILLINKFLHLNGGSETYVLKLGEHLQADGHEVQYFGMEHEGRVMENRVGSYTSNMDFHNGSKLAKFLYPIKTIYSTEARKKIRLVLDDFQPDVCHLNNFNYQLTPSIILEIKKWSKQTNHACKIIYTAHDYQLVCPNHMCRNLNTQKNCEKCLGGRYINCIKGKCIHGSLAKSIIGCLEASFWNWLGVYKQIDMIVCCSNFVKTKLDTNAILAKKTVTLHNFIEQNEWQQTQKKDYVLYFGRYSQEKGISLLIRVAESLPHVQFVFAGLGPFEELLLGIPNIQNVGFQKGEALEKLIREARFVVCPSEWYEPFGLTIAEAIVRGTPVIGADIGGIPEVIQRGQTGVLFESGNQEELTKLVAELWDDKECLSTYIEGCREAKFATVSSYSKQLLSLLNGEEFTGDLAHEEA